MLWLHLSQMPCKQRILRQASTAHGWVNIWKQKAGYKLWRTLRAELPYSPPTRSCSQGIYCDENRQGKLNASFYNTRMKPICWPPLTSVPSVKLLCRLNTFMALHTNGQLFKVTVYLRECLPFNNYLRVLKRPKYVNLYIIGKLMKRRMSWNKNYVKQMIHFSSKRLFYAKANTFIKLNYERLRYHQCVWRMLNINQQMLFSKTVWAVYFRRGLTYSLGLTNDLIDGGQPRA